MANRRLHPTMDPPEVVFRDYQQFEIKSNKVLFNDAQTEWYLTIFPYTVHYLLVYFLPYYYTGVGNR